MIRHLLLTLLVILAAGLLFAQESQQSPVFKSYRQPGPGAIIEQTDATYQMWQTLSLFQKANAGDMLAQHEIGVRYLVGRGMKADTVRGAYWTRKAAEQKMATAQFNLGILLSNGWGVEWNPFEAFDMFRSAARFGMPEALYVLAQFYTENLVVSRDWSEAYRLVKAASDSGFGPAQQALAELERKGKAPDAGVAEPSVLESSRDSSRQQLNWTPVFLDFDADSSAPVSDRMLLEDLLREGSGEMHQSLGISASDTLLSFDDKALASLRTAAEAGSPEALTVLGRCYERGIRVHKDKVVAAAFYVRAIRFDSPRAYRLLLDLLEDRTIGEMVKQRAKAQDNDARFVWATLLALGIYHPLSIANAFLTEQQALELLRSASSAGHVPSLIELGLFHYSGRWVTENRRKAGELWKKAADMGSIEASVRLAAAVVQEGVEDSSGVVNRLLVGIEGGSVLAEVALGLCNESGFGVERNTAEAARRYRKAARRGSQDGYRALIRLHDEMRPPDAQFSITDDSLR